jgi:hypothetical protein
LLDEGGIAGGLAPEPILVLEECRQRILAADEAL